MPDLTEATDTTDSVGVDTVILGSGIIGLCTAFYLSQSPRTVPTRIHLVDSSPQLFQCASGLAGGFLAADWFAPSAASLGALSFKLHKDLADKYNGKKLWGYGLSTGSSLSQDSDSAIAGSGEDFLRDGTSRAQAAGVTAALNSDGPPWLKRIEGGTLEVISRENSTGQIDPSRFCAFLLDQCLSRGVQVHYPAKAVSVIHNSNNQLNGLRISQDSVESDLPCSRLVITAGAWTPKVFSTLFPKSPARIPIASLAGHSLLLRNPHFKEDDEACHAVFAADTLGFSPELFSRTGGEIYIAGLNTTQIPLPEISVDAKPNEEAIQKLKDCAEMMVGAGPGGEQLQILRESLCFRPVTSSGRPIVCRVPEEKLGGGIRTRGGAKGGVFIAAGHGAWGISQAPGTGLCCAELIEGLQASATISALSLP